MLIQNRVGKIDIQTQHTPNPLAHVPCVTPPGKMNKNLNSQNIQCNIFTKNNQTGKEH